MSCNVAVFEAEAVARLYKRSKRSGINRVSSTPTGTPGALRGCTSNICAEENSEIDAALNHCGATAIIMSIGRFYFGAFSPWQCAPVEALSRGGASGQEGDGVDLDLRVQQQAGDLHGGAGGRVLRKELAADA